jgi:hypothetical protein
MAARLDVLSLRDGLIGHLSIGACRKPRQKRYAFQLVLKISQSVGEVSAFALRIE